MDRNAVLHVLRVRPAPARRRCSATCDGRWRTASRHLPLTFTDLEHNITLPSMASGPRSQVPASTTVSTVTLLAAGVLLVSVRALWLRDLSRHSPPAALRTSLPLIAEAPQDREFPRASSCPLPYLPPCRARPCTPLPGSAFKAFTSIA